MANKWLQSLPEISQAKIAFQRNENKSVNTEWRIHPAKIASIMHNWREWLATFDNYLEAFQSVAKWVSVHSPDLQRSLHAQHLDPVGRVHLRQYYIVRKFTIKWHTKEAQHSKGSAKFQWKSFWLTTEVDTLPHTNQTLEWEHSRRLFPPSGSFQEPQL